MTKHYYRAYTNYRAYTTLLRRSVGLSIAFTAWFAFFFPGIAHAYVDPGSGSVIVTAILGAIGAIGYSFRKQFYRLRRKFRGEKDTN